MGPILNHSQAIKGLPVIYTSINMYAHPFIFSFNHLSNGHAPWTYTLWHTESTWWLSWRHSLQKPLKLYICSFDRSIFNAHSNGLFIQVLGFPVLQILHKLLHLLRVFINLISDLRVVESVCIGVNDSLRYVPNGYFDEKEDDLHLTDVDFIMEWLPRVSESLKSLSITDFLVQSRRETSVLFLFSVYCKFVIYSCKSCPMLIVKLSSFI